MVDLSKGEQGRIKFRNGEEWWCPVVDEREDGFFLRFEHGWYVGYTQDGIRIDGGMVISPDGTETILPSNHDRDIIEFEPGVFPGLQAGCNP